MSNAVVVFGLLDDFAALHALNRDAHQSEWTKWKYYTKVIGDPSARVPFEQWFAQNSPVEHWVNTATTRRGHRNVYYFNCDDFALLLKLSWETISETT